MKAFEEVARSAKNNQKTFHKYVNRKTKVRVGIAELHTAETKAISVGEKASTLNDYFASVFTNENDNLPACEGPNVDTPCAYMRLTR